MHPGTTQQRIAAGGGRESLDAAISVGESRATPP